MSSLDPTHHDYSLLAPGPVNLHPEVRAALGLPMIHHRTPEFDKILSRVLAGLKKIFQTTQPVYMHSSTGSGGMESLLVNTVSPGETVLAIVSGKFGERWAEMAKVFGAKVIVHNVEWGKSVRVDDVQLLLKQNPETRAVLCQACETSTAVVHPIRALAALIAPLPNTLLLVDAITGLGAFPLPMDEWKIDGIVAGSQKALMLPTGLSFVAFSKKAESFFEKCTTPRYYYDIRREKKSNANGETFFSSSVTLVRALDVVLRLIDEQGLDALFASIHRRAEATRIFAQKLGFGLYAQSPSDSVTALTVPATMDGQKIRSYLEEKFNITIMGGQDQAKGKIIRIGHMGYIQDAEMIRLMSALGKTLQSFDVSFISDEKIEAVASELRIWLGAHS
ncbi:MAG: alanine--glyoxylate aminotransferase family protein [Bdellovibrionaceae bacterium]|nr:alanine--glyoxylate aminotransferase family protein [Pseudobdellovibrionaceae bacterium]